MKKERAARKERLALQVGIALTAGVFGAVPVAEGAPVVDKVVTAGTQVARSGSVTDVTGTQANNIVKWQDFSVGKGETVRFDDGAKERNYLNLVTGPKESEIAGKVEGGKDVYLVNPHGVIFSHGAQVDIGNLYVSTENTEAALQAFSAGKTAGEVLTAGTANADVVNLGGVAASTVIVNGDNIRFLTDDVQATQVTLQAAKNIIQEQDAARGAAPGVLRAASLSSSAPSYVLHAANTESRRAILNNAGLAEMNNNLSGSYSLEADLTLSGSYTPIGGDSGAFTGTFDGNFHTISGIQVSGGTYGGLFGLTSGATIQNVGVKDGSVTAVHAGGIVGKAVSTTLTDVYNAGVDITAIDNDTDYSGFSAGGIVGYAKNSKIGKVYNTGTVNGEGAGLIGCAESGTTLTNAYNTGAAHYAVVAWAPSSDTSNISYTYATQGLTHSEFYGGKLDTDTVFSVTSQDTKLKKYKDKNFDISDSGSGKNGNTVWRIYEGHSLPLLRDFLRRGKGAVTVNYDYTHDGGNNYDSNNGSDLTLTYNNQAVKLRNINYTNANGLAIDASKITQDTGSLRNANVYSEKGETSNGQQAFYCTSQDGYDLVGNNVYINQREVNISGDSVKGKHITKVYDGKVDVSDAVKALFNASDTSVTGLIAGDTTASLTTNDLKASFDDKNVGVGRTVTANGTLTLTQTAHNYKVTGSGTAQLKDVTLFGDITPATLTLSLADGKTLTKVYEGKANAATKETVSSLLSSDKTVTGLQTDDNGKTDVVTLGFQKADAKGTYGTKNSDGTFTPDGNAGEHAVQLAGIQLSGTDAKNYNLVDASGNIIWGEKYTAGADATASGTLTPVGKTSGGTAYLSGTITKRNLTADGFTWYDGSTPHAVKNNTKEYDNSSAYADANGKQVNKADSSATGLVSGDSVAFTVKDSGTHFVKATVTDGKVTVSNDDAKTVKDANAIAYAVTVSGEDARNYTLNGSDIQDGGTATVYGEGHITPRTLLVAAADGKVFEKTYDGDKTIKTSDGRGTAAAPFTMADGYLAYTGDVNHQLLNDGAKITYTGTYSDKNVARGASGKATTKDVTFTAQVKDADGQPSQNYVFLNGDSKSTTMAFVGKGIINPAKITAVTFDDASKQYDSTSVNSSITMTGATGLVNGESFSDILQAGTDSQYVVQNGDTYQETPHVNATNASYTVSIQNPKGNYDLALPQDAQGHYLAYGKGTITPLTITKITLNPKANTHITKVYDGNNDVTHVENGQTVEAKSYVTTLEADIPNSTNKLTFTQDAPSLGYTVEDARFDEKNSHNSQKQNVTYYLDVKGPDGFADYTFDASLLDQEGRVKAAYAPQGVITPREVKPVVKGSVTKVFDGTTAVVGADGTKLSGNQLVDLQGILAADQGSVTNGTTAVYQNANVNRAGNYEDGKGFVQYTYQLDGDANGNYHLTQTSGTGDGTITPRHLTAEFSSVHKTYDGNTTLVGTVDNQGLPTIKPKNLADKDTNKDQIGVSYRGVYASPDVTDDNYVKYTDVALTNNDDGNYILDLSYLPNEAVKTVRGEGKITSAQVTKNDIVTLFAPITKIYDGNTNVAYDHTSDAAYDADYQASDARSKTAADFLQDGDDVASGTQSIRIKGRALTYGKDYDYTIAADNGATYDGKDAGNHNVMYRFQLSDTVRRNYDFDSDVFSGGYLLGKTQGIITQKTVTAALSGVTDVIEKKAYDGKTTLPDGTDVTNRVTFRGLLGSDAQLGKVTGAYDTKDVARNADGTVGTKDVLYTPSLDVTGAANYQLKLVSPEGAALTGTTLTGAGQGRILPKELGFTADRTDKPYDATADAAVINPAFTGFVGSESLAPGTVDGTADGKSLVKAQYGIYDGTTFTPDENVEGDEEDKAVAYQNLQQALVNAAGQKDTIKASNYTIADTVYFDKPKEHEQGQGKIKRLALSASDIKERWSGNIQKQYDGTTAVDLTDPEKNFQIYIDETTANGTKLKLPKTVYLHYELDASKGSAQYNSADVKNADAVTYHISGLKNSEKLANNFTFSDGGSLDLEKYKGDFTLKNGETSGSGIMVGDGTQRAVVGITKRVLRVHADGHNDKTYDGNAAADAGHLVLADGTDGKLAQDIANILQNDKTDLASHVVANYMATGGAQETAAAANVGAKHDASQGEGGKVVAYTVDLAAGKDLTANYALDTSQAAADGVTKQESGGTETQGTYIGHGDILRRVVYVSFADADAENRKEYDGTPTVTDKADDLIRKFALSDEDAANKTGIIRDDTGRVRVTGATGTYDTAHVKRGPSGNVLEGYHTVTYQGFTLKNADGSGNTNYELAAADGRMDEQGNAVLVGKGTITPATLHVSLKDANVTKVYDATRDVKDATYGLANVEKRESDLKTGKHNVRDAVHITLLGTPQYDNKNANIVKGQKTENRSVTYELTWDNPDYELALTQGAPSQSLDVTKEVSAGNVGTVRLVTNAATITPKTVTAALSGVKDTIEKTYDGNATLPTADLKNRVTFTGLYDEDQQLAKVAGVYDTKDVAWNADGTVGTKNILYTPKLEGTGAANYELALVTPDGKTLTGATLTGEGQGRITPRQLTITAGYAEKIYDGTADAEVLNPQFAAITGVADTGLAAGELLTPGTVDGKSLVTAQYGVYDGENFTPDANVEGDEAYKAVAYQHLQQALENAAGQTATIKASNYTIADTVYFDQAKQQGKIKRLALTARDIKQRWGSDIQKQYDGTQAIDVKDPKAYLTLYITGGTGADGRNVALPQTLTLDYDLDGAQYNSADVRNADAVTYHINGVKNGANITNNFRFDDGVTQDLTKYQGYFTLKNGEVSDIARGVTVGDGRETAVVAIKKRVLKGEVTSGHNDKIYNGETAADSSFLVLTDGTDGKSAAEIEAMLVKDGTTFGNLVQANYIDAQGHDDASASTRAADHDATRPGTKQVRYTVSLTDALKDNYAVDKDDTTKTETSYDGFGDIFKRVVYVDFANDKEDTKTYDGYDDVKKPLRTFALSDEQGDTGIIKADQGKVHLDTQNITGKYASAHVKCAADGTPVAQQVSYRGFGVDNANYEVRAKAADGADSDTLVGMGTITPAALHVGLRDANVTQAYDNTLDVEDLARYGEANVQLADGDLKTVNNVRDTVNVKLSGTPQYDKKDANVIQGRKTENRSVTYELTWDNPDYELAVAQDVPSQTLDVTEEISSGGVGTARLVTDAALITPRTVTLAADPAKTATRLYDGASGGAAEHAIGNLEAGNLAKGEKLINLFLAPGATEESYLPETVLRSAYDSDPNAGRDGVAVAGDRNDLRAHTVTYTYTLQNPNYQLDATGRTVGTASGQGVIRRRDVTVTADPVTMAMGHALPVFTGGTSGFIAEDAAVQTSFESGLQFRPEDSVTAPSVGTYGVYGWYRTREEQEVTVPAVLDQDGKTVVTPAHTEKQLVDVWHREGNLGLNYYFQQDAGNDTALTVTRPTADWPRSLEEAFRPAQQYVPDGNAYHRVSYDTHQETNRTPTVGIEYAAGGLNVGAAGAAAAALEGGRDVVNLGGTRAAVVDVTSPGAAEFVVSGERAVPGVTEAAWTKLAASEARGAAAALGGDAGRGAAGGALATQAGSAASSAAGALAAQAGSGSSAAAGATSPAAVSRGGAARNADVSLFYDMEERQPSRLASTAEAQLFGDAVPTAKEAAAAPVKLFADDGAAQHAAAGAAAPARGTVPALFDDAASAAAEQPSSDAIEVTTSPADEDDEQKEKEEAARAAALQAKGAAIGIESEGAGVNLAG
ncbi:YDG domain-containing protein [Selenomonas bovis]|uniref:YDG domain-containing protein n=1 Tax=Selenomonas bovis TaxID=416586 RepID=UPI0004E24E81|nr:YDG domain-containing protein [Selenomonas bovis]